MQTAQNQPSIPSSFPAQMTFRPVAVKNVRPEKNSDQPAVDVEANGRVDMNQAASDMTHNLAKEHNLNPREYVLALATGDEGYIAMKPVPLGTPEAAKVSTHKDGKISVQIHELFDEDPELRPTVRQRCYPFITKNQDGESVIVIGLKVGQDKPVRPRTSNKKTNS